MASGSKAAMAARWARAEGQMTRFWASRSTRSTRSSGRTSQPSRQPVIDQYLEKLLTTIGAGPAGPGPGEGGQRRAVAVGLP